MDKKPKYYDLDNRKSRQKHDKISSGTTSNSKVSIKTQTEESSFLFNSCSCHRKIFNNFNDNEISRCHMKMDCIPPSGMCACPSCSQSQNSNQFHRYPLPFYGPGPYGHCGVPPFIPMQWFHNPFLNNNNYSNGLPGYISTSKTSVSTNRATNCAHHGGSTLSMVDDENYSNVSNNYDLNDNRIKNKLLTSSIRSEPNVLKNTADVKSGKNSSVKNLLGKFKLSKNTLSSLLNKNVSKKIHFKSDSNIPLTTDLKVKNSDHAFTRACDKGTSSYEFDKIGSSLRCNNKGDYKYNEKDFLKSPIYQYADIRIHELSSSLKSIKDSLYRLSTKASELNVTDSECENDDYKKYFKRIYSEFCDEDAPVYLNNNVPKMNGNRINCNNDNINGDSIRAQRVKQSEILPCSTFSLLRKEGTELFSDRFLSESNFELPGSNNKMKRTLPVHDIPSLLNQNKLLSSVKPVKVNLDKSYKDRITAHIIVPERSSNLKRVDKDENKSCLLSSNFGKEKLNNLSKRYANISFKLDYDSFNDSCNFGTHDREDDCDEQIKYSESNKGKRSNDYKSVSSATYFNSDEKRVSDNNNDYHDGGNVSDIEDEDGDRENSWCVQEKVLSPPVLIEENTMNIENWLEKNAETSEQNHSVYNSSPSQKRCQLNSLSNLEILSKISEEDEDKFSCLSGASGHAKSLLIRDKFFYTSNRSKYSKNINLKNVENSCLLNINDSNKGSSGDCLYLMV